MSAPPKPVLYISQHADIVGGGEVSLLSLVKNLDRSRWAPSMVVSGEGTVARACRALDIPTYCVPMPSCRWPSRDMRGGLGHLRHVVRSTGAQLLHANGTRAMIYAGLVGRRAGTRVIWHVRVEGSDGLLDRFLAAMAHRIIVNSQAVARRFPFVSKRRLRCIYNGIDLKEFSNVGLEQAAQFRKQFGIPTDAPLVVSVGRLERMKGYAELIQAAHALKDKTPAIHWLVVGHGEEQAALETMARDHGVTSVVHFTGWLPEPRIPLAACDVFVLPSLSEGFGRVVVEAMAMGKAVVTTKVGGIPEIVVPGETGILVPPSDAHALGNAVLGLIKNPALASMFGSAGLARARREFSLTKHVAEIHRTYEELLA